MAEFSVDVRAHDGTCELILAGQIDVAVADQLRAEGIRGLASVPTGPVIVDVGAVSFLDSTGLGALIQLRTAALGAGRTFALRNVGPRIEKLFKITGLDAVFGSTDDSTGSGSP